MNNGKLVSVSKLTRTLLILLVATVLVIGSAACASSKSVSKDGDADIAEGLFLRKGHPYVVLRMGSEKSVGYYFDLPGYREGDTSTYSCMAFRRLDNNMPGIVGYHRVADAGWVAWYGGQCLYTPDDVEEGQFQVIAGGFGMIGYDSFDLANAALLDEYGIHLSEAWFE